MKNMRHDVSCFVKNDVLFYLCSDIKGVKMGYSEATKRFLLAAKHAEISALKRLLANCQVVNSVSVFIHQLQNERGTSNIFLASRCERFTKQRTDQILQSVLAEELLRSQFKAQYLIGHDTADNMRLLNSISIALQGMDHLPVLRHKIDSLAISPLNSSQAYCRLVAGLLNVVFEAADVASDPAITRILVAMFNFMQGKEYTGQERAWGAIGFAETHFNQELCERLEQLQVAQRNCFQIFLEFASQSDKQLWLELETSTPMKSIEQLRNMIRKLVDGSPISAEISEVWYDVATQRINQMHVMEESIAETLVNLANKRVKQASAELRHHNKRLKMFADLAENDDSSFSILFDSTMPGLRGAENLRELDFDASNKLNISHSFYDLLRDQCKHIKKMADELNDAKCALTEQKTIDRARLLMMEQLKLSEAEAYRLLQKRAMDNNIRIAEMADLIVKATSSNQSAVYKAKLQQMSM
jgi:hypothetical protein